MQQKVILCLALVCLAALPAFHARGLLEEGDLVALATAALESGQAMSAEESMLMQSSGTYGAGNMVGSYGGQGGGILDNTGSTTDTPVVTTPNSDLESGNQDAPKITSNTPATAAIATPAAGAKSAALPTHQSAGLLAAGVMVALTAFLL